MNTCGAPSPTQSNPGKSLQTSQKTWHVRAWLELEYGIVSGRVKQQVQESGGEREQRMSRN